MDGEYTPTKFIVLRGNGGVSLGKKSPIFQTDAIDEIAMTTKGCWHRRWSTFYVKWGTSTCGWRIDPPNLQRTRKFHLVNIRMLVYFALLRPQNEKLQSGCESLYGWNSCRLLRTFLANFFSLQP